MPDIFSPGRRSRIMANVKSRNTAPELLVRSQLHRRGLRFRIHYERLPGSPDICFPKYRTVLFVNGCFWHGHPGCPRAELPQTNREKWKKKIEGNMARDRGNDEKLRLMGWKVLIVWTCELRKDAKYFDELYASIVDEA